MSQKVIGCSSVHTLDIVKQAFTVSSSKFSKSSYNCCMLNTLGIVPNILWLLQVLPSNNYLHSDVVLIRLLVI